MTYAECLDWLSSLHKRGMCFGLDRIKTVLSHLGSPQERLSVVHIAGTNGKGSVSAMVQNIATAAGYRTGLFSSPTPLSVLDSVTVDGVSISPADFAALCTEVKKQCEALSIFLSEFEVNTLIALLYFSQKQCTLAVIECGMGGEQDATNVFSRPTVCALTAVSLDHTAFLGDTLAAITKQKCGIVKAGCTIVTDPSQDEDVLATVFEDAAEKGAFVRLPSDNTTLLSQRPDGIDFIYNGVTYATAMTGDFQMKNARLALEIISVLSEKGFYFTEKHRQNGLLAAKLPCRQEYIESVPPVLLDAAHNEQGIAALSETLKILFPNTALVGLFGMLKDKDTAACVAHLAPLFQTVICCTPQNERAMSALELAAQFAAHGVAAQAIDDPVEALCKAKQLVEKTPLIVGGSFYVAFPVREKLK